LTWSPEHNTFFLLGNKSFVLPLLPLLLLPVLLLLQHFFPQC
jgi:hypothetical protein